MNAVITGIGALSPLGLDLESFWSALLEEKDCIREGIGAFDADQWKQIEERLAATTAIPAGKVARISYLAAEEAMRVAGWDYLDSDDGLILGTTTGQINHWEKLLMQSYARNNFDKFFAAGGISTPGRALHELCALLNFNGKSMMIVSACSASTQAVGIAAEWVKSGRVKRCLVGGAEVLTALSVEGFRSLGLLANVRSKPFDEARSGINLSEAAAFYCIEKVSNSSEASRAVAEIKAYATNSDAYHLTAPHPEGRGTLKIFEDLLKSAKLNAADIDWIHAHGTASLSNDKAEGQALAKTFPTTSVTSTKAYHGHSLGAAGALELAICVQALRQQLKLKSLGCDNLDPGLKINNFFSLQAGGTRKNLCIAPCAT